MKNKKSVLCFFHFPCPDGASAAVTLKHLLTKNSYLENNFQFVFCPLTHLGAWEDLLPTNYVEKNIEPKYEVVEIFILDIALSKNKINQIIDRLRLEKKITTPNNPPIICIDHHKTALEKIEEINSYCQEADIRVSKGLSGATLTWDYCNKRFGTNFETPIFLKYVADQDLWEWDLENSKEINASINTKEDSVEQIEDEFLYSLAEPDKWLQSSILRGVAINDVVSSQVRKAFANTIKKEILGTTLLITNATSFASEVGNKLCEEYKYKPNCVAVVYSILDNLQVRCSFRSLNYAERNARQIAEFFGGGGHDNAAGCRFQDFETFKKAFDI